MVWTPELSKGDETAKCRFHVASFLRGRGIDLGCGNEKIAPDALGVDLYGEEADIRLDLGAPDSLAMFADGGFDYVYSSHCLEDFKETRVILEQWWRLVRPGGHLILYGPDPDYYPHKDTAGANPSHKVDLHGGQVWEILKGLGSASLVHLSRHNETNEYSWLLVVRKTTALRARALEMLHRFSGDTRGVIAKRKRTRKDCVLIRYGAIGDMLWLTPALKLLKKDGWNITLNCWDYSAQVLKENPNIDHLLVQGRDVVPNAQLPEYWEVMANEFDRVINFSGSVEGTLLKQEGKEEFDWPQKRRHKQCNFNYQDATMARAGYREVKGCIPELHFTDAEHQMARAFRTAHDGKFVILWSLSGSSFHKVYPWTEYVAQDICRKHRDVRIVTVGDDMCRILEWSNSQTFKKSGVFTIRQSMILTGYVDLVIGTETGILNAASAYDTPKLIFLSHSSVENLTKYWKNCTPLYARDCKCQPCHRLIYTNSCPPGSIKGIAPACMENIRAETVYGAFLRVYKEWQNGHRN